MKRLTFVLAVLALVLPIAALAAQTKPATWIADRAVKGRIFLENDG